MARTFSPNESLMTTTTPVADLTAHGVTLAAWVKWDSEPTLATHIMSLGDSGDTGQFAVMGVSFQSDDTPIANQVQSGTNASATGGTDMGLHIGKWVHIAATFEETGGRRYSEVFFNGTPDAADDQVTSGTNSWDRIAIGRTADSTAFGYFNGHIADAALWNVVLTDAQIATLANSISPLVAAPSNLIFYTPLNNAAEGVEIDLIGGLSLAEEGTPTYSEGPLLSRGWPSNVISTAAAGGGGFQSAWAASSNTLISNGITI